MIMKRKRTEASYIAEEFFLSDASSTHTHTIDSVDCRVLPDPRYTLIVPGEPIPKARPRFAPSSKRVWTDQKTKGAEERIGWLWKEKHGLTQLEGELAIRLRFICSSRRRGDLSNLIKLVEDGLNGIAYRDDRQIVRIEAEIEVEDKERLGKSKPKPRPRTEIKLWEVSDLR